MISNRLKSWLRSAIAASAFLPILCWAYPYSYTFVLTVEKIEQSCIFGTTQPGFGCSVPIGTQWTGHFQIAQEPPPTLFNVLSTPFITMHLETGTEIWDHCVLTGACIRDPNNFLVGYRNPLDPAWFVSDDPGFYVSAGHLSGIAGGFYGGSDATFIDFDYMYSPGAHRFFAGDLNGQHVSGTYTLLKDPIQVPTPDTLTLVILALAGLMFIHRISQEKSAGGVWPSLRFSAAA